MKYLYKKNCTIQTFSLILLNKTPKDDSLILKLNKMMEATTETIERVLIIDDNEIDALICTKVFKKYDSAIELVTFVGAKEALEFLKDKIQNNPESLPDLILLDLYMPLMNGWFFLTEYKKIAEQLPKKIVIIVASSTTYDKDLTQIQAHKEISGHLSKPLTVEKIQHIQEKHFD